MKKSRTFTYQCPLEYTETKFGLQKRFEWKYLNIWGLLCGNKLEILASPFDGIQPQFQIRFK